MTDRRSVGRVLVMTTLVTAGCGGGSAFGETTTTAAATTTVPTAATVIPTTTTTSSTAAPATTTRPPTTTTTTTTTPPPLVPVIGWQGEGLRELTVVIAFEYEPAAGLGDLVASALEAMGLEVAPDADTMLALTLEGNPLSAVYGAAGTCYTGARIRGMLTLSAPGQPTLQFDLDAERPTAPLVIGGDCRQDPEDAPFDWTFEPEFKDAVVAIWGTASVPYLTQILVADHYLVRLRTEAVQAYRLMDPEAIPAEQQHAFMSAAVQFVGRSLHISDDDIATYREAVRRLLLTYSDTDYGFESLGEVAAWQTWLDGWLAGQ